MSRDEFDDGSDVDAGFDAAMAQIDAWSAANQQQLASATAVQQAIEQLSVTVWSPRREVCVTVDHRGLLRDIVFEERALSITPLALGTIVTTTIHRALATLQDRVIAAARAAAGPGSPMALAVENEYRTVFERPLAALGDQRPGSGS